MRLENIKDYIDSLDAYLDMIIDGLAAGLYPSANESTISFINDGLNDEFFLADKINILFSSGLINIDTYKKMMELFHGVISREDAEDLMNEIEILATSSSKRRHMF